MRNLYPKAKFIVAGIVLTNLTACNGQIKKQETTMHQHTNALIKESSPYLLQHVHNPVNWQPWGDAAFEQAKKEGKLVIISIGYSACHWCHVMERETFEDSTAAALMNKHFVPIKIDREEHPDVDQVYMTAVQLMTGSGGWPLNVVTLPDGRPIWGGTYFPKEKWMNALESIYEVQRDEPEKIVEYAQRLTEGVQQSALVQANTNIQTFNKLQADELFENWQERFDYEEGGPNRAPKFPLPNNYNYLLQYGHLSGNEKALNHVKLTLDKMAWGGIYDQAGGGFARYSTDVLWKAPHFEKMLYDNAQLLSLYANAWRKFKSPLYAKTVQETVTWALREMQGENGEFYTALDADSEGEEGKFYVWTESELKAIIPVEDWDAFTKYYNLQKGSWEHGNIILMRNEGVSLSVEKENEWQSLLLKERQKRVRPGLDDKSLTSWNAMMITGLVDANMLSPEKDAYLKQAETCAKWLLKNQNNPKNELKHAYKKGKSYIDGLAEDYAFSIEAFLKLYEVTGNEMYLNQAVAWLKTLNAQFLDEASALYYTRSTSAKKLIAQSIEVTDNVTAAPNSVLAQCIFKIGRLTGEDKYLAQAEKMLSQINVERFLAYGESYSNWAQLHLWLTMPYYEVAVVGASANELTQSLRNQYLPNILLVQSDKENTQPLFENRFVKDKTLIYVCQNRACKLPVEKVEKALSLLGENGL